MKWKRLFFVCSSLFLFLCTVGCKKTIRINVDPSLAPPSATTVAGATVEWNALSPGESFDVIFDSGLCTQKSPLHASYGHPAVCTIAPQQFKAKDQLNFYDYSIEGANGQRPPCPKLRMAVGPGHCPHC